MQSLLMIFKSTIFSDRFCSNYQCQQMSHDVYHVADPDGSYFGTDIFCLECAKHLAANIPPELAPSQAEVEGKVRAKVYTEHELVIEHLNQEIEKLKEQLNVATEIKSVIETSVVTDVPFADEVEEDTTVVKPVYRCLECSAEFDSPQKVKAHKKREHE